MPQTNHLTRRNGVWYYRRRVPLPLVEKVGCKIIQFSLRTADLKEAKKRRTVEDLKTTIRFEATTKSELAEKTPLLASDLPPQTAQVSAEEIIRLVQDYVERSDNCWQHQLTEDPPESHQQQDEIKTEVDQTLSIVQNRDDPRSDEFIHGTAEKILQGTNRTMDDPALPYTAFAEWVRRGLVELQRRKHARLDDQPVAFFDAAFGTRREHETTFAQLADQAIQIAADDAAINGISEKWIDKQRANFVLLREIIGDTTPIRDIDYDACLRVRTVLARVPAGRTKAYSGISLDDAIARADKDKRPGLSARTQEIYLATLKGALDLASKKRLIGTNPAMGLRPLKRDAVQASAKRLPLSPTQLKSLFEGPFYRSCAHVSPPFSHDPIGWRFWLPLLCLFMGLRPNEACQLRAADVKRTEEGTWYVDVVETADEDERGIKTLKTETSRRRVPIHPELLAIGFIDFVRGRLSADCSAMLFAELKPDVYGNYAKYPLKRFREQYLPKEVALEPRQSFYSLRHNFRDALRRIDAPPDALQALGGWSQGKLVSDDYGDRANPDYQIRFMKQISFPGVNLKHLHCSDLQVAETEA